jgi:uncharacterized protein YeaO (DUF488 family)
MQDEAFQGFETRYLQHLQHQEKDNGEALRRHDQRTGELEKKISNLMDAIENVQHSDVIVERLNLYDQELKTLQATRDRLVPRPITLPDDMPSFYRMFIDELVAPLPDEAVERLLDAVSLTRLWIVWSCHMIMTPRATFWTCRAA